MSYSSMDFFVIDNLINSLFRSDLKPGTQVQ